MNYTSVLFESTQDPHDFTVEIRHIRNTESTVGTGFSISSDGLLLTCAHVVMDAGVNPREGTAVPSYWKMFCQSISKSGDELINRELAEITVFFPRARKKEEQFQRSIVLACSEEYDDDIVILKLLSGKLPEGLIPAKLDVGQNCDGHEFRSYGYSRIDDYAGMPADGKILGFIGASEKKLRCQPLRLRSQEIESGMSGAAVLDTQLNRIVGVVSEAYDSGRRFRSRDTGFAVSINVLRFNPFRNFLERVLQPQLLSPGKRRRLNRDTTRFLGRTEQQDQLKKWINEEYSRLIFIWGMGGIGKTDLASKVIDDVEIGETNEFEYIWEYKLEEGPPFKTVVSDAIKFLSDQKEIFNSDKPSELISRLIDYLTHKRCLLLLDNAETVLTIVEDEVQSEDALRYWDLLKQLSQSLHQSCVIVTTREKPQNIYELEGDKLSTHVLQLEGLFNLQDGILLCQNIAPLNGTEPEWQEFIQYFRGNPLYLRIAASYIKDVCKGSLGLFLKDSDNQRSLKIANMNNTLLNAQFDRLGQFEQEVLYWLAINRKLTTASELQDDVLGSPTEEEVSEALVLLRNRSLVQSVGNVYYDLHPVIQEFLSNRLVLAVCDEIRTGEIYLTNAVAFLKAQSSDYIRTAQNHFILQPIKTKLRKNFSRSNTAVKRRLEQILRERQEAFPRDEGYLAGNILDILLQLNAELERYDFSNLCVWQAYLRDQELRDVNFAFSDLRKSVFTQTFGSILSLDFSPDGIFLATSDVNGQVRLWRVNDGQAHLTINAHEKWVWSVAFSPDGSKVVSGSDDTTVKVWDTETGQCLQSFQEHTNKVWSVTFSNSGELIASGSEDNTIRIWNADTGLCIKVLEGHSSKVWSLDFNITDEFLVSASQDETAKVWNVSSGECLITFNEHTNWVRCAKFSPDGTTIASSSNDQTIKIWDVATGECSKTLEGHTHKVWSVDFDSLGMKIVSGSVDQTIRVWDVATGQCLNTLQGHNNWVRSVKFSPVDDKLVASGSDDQTTMLWDINSGERVYALHGYTNGIWAVAVSPDGRVLATGGDDYKIRLWDIDSKVLLRTLEHHENWILSVAFSPDGTTIASGSDDFTISIWDTRAELAPRVLKGHGNKVWSVCFSHDSKRIASGSRDGTARIWDVANGENTQTVQSHPSQRSGVQSVAFNHSSEKLAIGCADPNGTILLWNCVSEEYEGILEGHLKRIWSVAFCPTDEKYLASGSEDRTIKIWDTSTGQCVRTLEGHTNWVRSIAYSLDGKRLISGSDDQMVKVWDAETGNCLRTLERHEDKVQAVAFSPTEQKIVSGSSDSTAILWNADNGEFIRDFMARRPYEGMNITGISGVTNAQKAVLKQLGAVENQG